MKVMYVHGVGFHEDPNDVSQWVPAWTRAIEESSSRIGVDFRINNPLGNDNAADRSDPGVLYYEDIIRSYPPPDFVDYSKAVGALLKSYFATKIGDFFRPQRRFLLSDEMRWKARQVAEWVENDDLREALRNRVVEEIEAKDPDVVIAHSYGGLITYDTCLFKKPDLLRNKYYVTLGTQIGNALLRKEFGGRQMAVNARHWFNLYNPDDPVFVCSLDHIRDDKFTNVVVNHGQGHDGVGYLGHGITANQVWHPISQKSQWTKRTRSIRTYHRKETRKPRNRALLVGVDKYIDPYIPPLAGCVNDTYQLSEALQEKGFDHKNIRMLHNERATRDNLIEGLEWLLQDAEADDHRFFSFSGHGHQLASLDFNGEPDEMDEILATYDYGYTQDTGLRDRDFQDLYTNLNEDVHFLIFLDCCHSGGITRDGAARVRSFRGPSDVEHTSKKWNKDQQMWEQVGLAGLKGLNPELYPKSEAEEKVTKMQSLYYGAYKDMRRIGRATPLRDVPHNKYDSINATLRKLHKSKIQGPYLPMVFMACGESEEAAEYVHGSVSYGAFTYAMAQALRDEKSKGRRASISYDSLHKNAIRKLKALNFPQNPEILGQRNQIRSKIPG